MGTLTLKPDFMELINCNIFSTFNISAHWIFPIFVLFLWMKSNVLHLVGQLKGWTMNLTFICQLSEIFFLLFFFFLPCINWHKNMNLKKTVSQHNIPKEQRSLLFHVSVVKGKLDPTSSRGSCWYRKMALEHRPCVPPTPTLPLLFLCSVQSAPQHQHSSFPSLPVSLMGNFKSPK